MIVRVCDVCVDVCGCWDWFGIFGNVPEAGQHLSADVGCDGVASVAPRDCSRRSDSRIPDSIERIEPNVSACFLRWNVRLC